MSGGGERRGQSGGVSDEVSDAAGIVRGAPPLVSAPSFAREITDLGDLACEGGSPFAHSLCYRPVVCPCAGLRGLCCCACRALATTFAHGGGGQSGSSYLNLNLNNLNPTTFAHGGGGQSDSS